MARHVKGQVEGMVAGQAGMRRLAGWRSPLWLTAMALALVACKSGGQQDQVVADYAIAYVKRVIPVDTNNNPPTLVEPDLREPAAFFEEGGDVYIRDRVSASAPEHNITACLTNSVTGGKGDVKDLESSYDGTKLIFSMRMFDPNPNDTDTPTWNIYEYDTTVGGCPTRVITSDIVAEKGDDLAPYYLPDGRIVFTSSRQEETGLVQLDEGTAAFPPLDENRREHALVLHVMPGSNVTQDQIKQISYNQSHDLDPSVMADGRIVFSRWDHMGSRNQINLYTVRPDGTELKLMYGAHQHDVGTNSSTVQFVAPRQLNNGRILSMIKPFTATGSAGGGAPVILNVENYADNTIPTWTNPGGTGPGQTDAMDLDVRTDGSISRAGRFRSVYPLDDGSNRALVSWSQCRLQETNGDIIPCPSSIPANAVEAFPLYGIYMYDLGADTQLPVVIPQEGYIYDEPVVLAPRTLPTPLYDKLVGDNLDLDQDLYDEHVGVLHIRSVYDFDGSFNNLGATGVLDLATMADPTQIDADTRPARWLRIVKAVSIPDDDLIDLANTAYGRSRQQGMRQIIGYAPIEPDGSVMVKVPANVPLAFSVVDKDGRRIGGRHQNWVQLRPGEVKECNGCHTHTTTAPALPKPHGYSDEATALNTGAATTGLAFPGTTTDVDPDPMVTTEIIANMGETMAWARIRTLCPSGLSEIKFVKATCPELNPSANPFFTDVWANGAIPDVVDLRYADIAALSVQPTSAAGCQDNPYNGEGDWDFTCRTIINYEEHIHPIWSQPRTDAATGMIDRTCTTCHNDQDAMGAAMVPAAQLDLSDGPSTDEPDHLTSYRELFFGDNQQEVVGGVLQDVTVQVQATDGNGNLLFQMVVDPVTGELVQEIDPMTGLPIPIMIDVPVAVVGGPSMSVNGANVGRFMGKFDVGGSHEGDLTPAEMRLISEWLDVGAQYFNNPFHPNVPIN